MADKPRGSLDSQRIGAQQQRIKPIRRQERRNNAKPRKQMPTQGVGTPPKQTPKITAPKQNASLAQRMAAPGQGTLQQPQQQQAQQTMQQPRKNPLASLPPHIQQLVKAPTLLTAYHERWGQ